MRLPPDMSGERKAVGAVYHERKRPVGNWPVRKMERTAWVVTGR